MDTTGGSDVSGASTAALDDEPSIGWLTAFAPRPKPRRKRTPKPKPLVLNAKAMMAPPPRVPMSGPGPDFHETGALGQAGDDIPTPRMNDFGHRARSLAKWREKLFLVEAQREQQRKWLAKHSSKAPFSFTPSQRRELRRWFDFIDFDHSGDISVDELKDPLLSTGIAQNFRDIEKLLSVVDKDDSGAIEFDEFLEVLRPSDQATQSTAASQAFVDLQGKLENQTDSSLSLPIMVLMQRRKILLDAILYRQTKREEFLKRKKKEEMTALRTGDRVKLVQLRQEMHEFDVAEARTLERMRSIQALMERNMMRPGSRQRSRGGAQGYGGSGMDPEDMLSTEMPAPLGGMPTSRFADDDDKTGDMSFMHTMPSCPASPDLAASLAGTQTVTGTDGDPYGGGGGGGSFEIRGIMEGGGGGGNDDDDDDDDDGFLYNMKVKRQIDRLNAAGGGMMYNPEADWEKTLSEAATVVKPSSSTRVVEFGVRTESTAAADTVAPPSAPVSPVTSPQRRPVSSSSDTRRVRLRLPSPKAKATAPIKLSSPSPSTLHRPPILPAASPAGVRPLLLPTTPSALAASGGFFAESPDDLQRAQRGLQAPVGAAEGRPRRLLSKSMPMLRGAPDLLPSVREATQPSRSTQKITTLSTRRVFGGARNRIGVSNSAVPPAVRVRQRAAVKLRKKERMLAAKAKAVAEAAAKKRAEEEADEWAIPKHLLAPV